MKQILLMMAAVVLVGCGEKNDPNTGVVNPNKPSTDSASEKLITDPIVEKAIRRSLYWRTGELTKVDLEKVTKLHLPGRNELTEVPKDLEKLTQLTHLELYSNQLTDVKGLEKLTQLETLSLSSNQLTDVTDLEKLTQLKRLSLERLQLTSVKGLEKLTKLTHLALAYNKLTDVKGLENLTQLKALRLTFNPDLTKVQIDELQKALPNCKIISNPTK